jgi:CDP-paratose synthetase
MRTEMANDVTNSKISKKILITGATGFVGSKLLREICTDQLRIVVRNDSNIIAKENQIILNCDNMNLIKFKREMEMFLPDIVIHLAACVNHNHSVESIKNNIESNIFFTSMLLEGLSNTNVKLFINTGTAAEYYSGKDILMPSNFYAASKSASRHIIKYYKRIIGFKTINIIPYTIYGGISRQKKVLDYIMESLNSNEPIEMTKGEQIFDFIHIDDVVNFYIFCINNYDKLNDEFDYHLGTGRGITIRALASLIESITKKDANIIWGAKPYRDLDIMRAVAPMKDMAELGWLPKIQLEEGIRMLTSVGE